MIRLRPRRLVAVRRVRTTVFADTTGGLARLESALSINFQGLLLPPQKRLVRSPSGVRLAQAWQLIPQGRPEVWDYDHIYIGIDPRCFVVTAVHHYPRHMVLHLELAQ